jgi:ABC-type phosphonate transport system ATPase subunit
MTANWEVHATICERHDRCRARTPWSVVEGEEHDGEARCRASRGGGGGGRMKREGRKPEKR